MILNEQILQHFTMYKWHTTQFTSVDEATHMFGSVTSIISSSNYLIHAAINTRNACSIIVSHITSHEVVNLDQTPMYLLFVMIPISLYKSDTYWWRGYMPKCNVFNFLPNTWCYIHLSSTTTHTKWSDIDSTVNCVTRNPDVLEANMTVGHLHLEHTVYIYTYSFFHTPRIHE